MDGGEDVDPGREALRRDKKSKKDMEEEKKQMIEDQLEEIKRKLSRKDLSFLNVQNIIGAREFCESLKAINRCQKAEKRDAEKRDESTFHLGKKNMSLLECMEYILAEVEVDQNEREMIKAFEV